MIHIEKVSKSFNGKPALKELTLDVQWGQIFGLLGHNGAGKSTTFGILLGQVHPNAGEAFIDGISVQRHRGRALARVGAIFETPGFYEYLSGWRNLKIFTSYSTRVPDDRLREVVELVDLTKRIGDPVRTYSHGMRQRLALAQALLPDPALVLLDEPTEGLDPEGIHEVRTLVQRLCHERGLTVLLSSHLLSEVEQTCESIAILNQGSLVFQGRMVDIAGKGKRYRLDVSDWTAAARLAAESGARIESDNVIELDDSKDIAAVVSRIVGAGLQLRALEPLRPTLEDFYLKVSTAQSAGMK